MVDRNHFFWFITAEYALITTIFVSVPMYHFVGKYHDWIIV